MAFNSIKNNMLTLQQPIEKQKYPNIFHAKLKIIQTFMYKKRFLLVTCLTDNY